MRRTTDSRTSRMIGVIRDTWAEFDYAQRRMLEMNMGINPPSRRRPASVEELESSYALEDPRLSD